ncbi:MAG: methionine--tRNA ligase, partial [Thermodesulfobacteriaceae bacterium]|nr:methionine--tRNA ligase [Thermodesulfobacteriaceae bacterium]
HLGHAYTTILVDGLSRFFRLKDYEVFFLTGTDEHGDKIVKASSEKKVSPKEFVDRFAEIFRKTWQELKITYNSFIRTTDPVHKKVVQMVLQKLYEKGEIYIDEYEGNYCFGCERFLTSKELDEKGYCKDHKKPPVYLREKNYFFDLEKYRSWLKEFLEKEEIIYPQFYKEEVLNLLEEPLPPLCISRPKSRLSWGIELPFDKDYVTYVWFDALINYLTGIGYPDNPNWKNYWSNACHIIAKDILKPHAIYWPIMLKALDLPVYKRLYVHGYLLMEKHKMSKSLGNVIDPMKLAKIYGIDALRYYLFREVAFGYDAEFNLENFNNRYHADLANDYGNLFLRTLSLIEKYFDSRVPSYIILEKEDLEYREKVERAYSKYMELFQSFQFHLALEELWQAIRYSNNYIDKRAPWKEIKEGRKEKAGSILRNLLSALKCFAITLYPIMPESSERILHSLSISLSQLNFTRALDWDSPEVGVSLQKGEPLFPRIEISRLEEDLMKEK